MKHALVIALVSLLLAAAATAQIPSRYMAGADYKKLPEPAETSSGEQIEVIEFFLYTCPHCHAFDPQVQAWADKLADDVYFHRVPVLFGRNGDVYARMFYSAKILGVLDKLHAKIFDAIHEQGKPLNDAEAIRAFFVAHGVSGKAFDRVFHSDKVDAKLAAAKSLMRSYGVISVPSLGVNGRYWINAKQAGSHKTMLNIADYLLQRTRNQR